MLARGLSALFNPQVCATVYLAALAAAGGPGWLGPCAEAWAVLVVAPMMLLGWGLYRGIWSDAEISRLQERRLFMPWLALAGALAVVLSVALGFPFALRLSIVGIFIWLLISTAISLFWKVSLHVGAITGVIGLVALVFGATPALWLLWLPAAVGWARVHLRAHNVAQVVAGACAGCAALLVAVAVVGL